MDTDHIADAAARLADVAMRVAAAAEAAGRDAGAITVIAVSKTFEPQAIELVLGAGHRIFGENRVQEAAGKWPALQARFADTELHLIGALQSNKAAEAVAMFDVVHSLDRDKLARELAKAIEQQGRAPQLFLQVNTGEEPQKAGIGPKEAGDFLARCRNEHGLAVSGLMCLPPFDEAPGPHFALLQKLAGELDLPNLSMGMSGDFETAIAFGATHIRVGTAIFGSRG
ncbi:MAG: YggS family pyridoxal phosphate-dependent enzyme [Alphaproteobacteria bacterium]|nr:MAG: YggS family pyridoxal phosphate-dependent enzyme [Alphaproteobacteria bacterium]